MSQFVRTFKRRKIFLDCLAAGDSISRAALAADGRVAQFQAWRKTDSNFSADWDEAIEGGTDYLEDVATERAVKKSDQLMLAILKARRPEKYDRAGKLELSGSVDVQGAKAKLLNKIARLQTAGAISSAPSQPEPALLESKPQEILLLPSSGDTPIRGRKRQAASGGGRRQSAP